MMGFRLKQCFILMIVFAWAFLPASASADRLEKLLGLALEGFLGMSAEALESVEAELRRWEDGSERPDAAVAMACRGIVLTVMAQEGSMRERRRLFRQSTRLLDQAVRAAPGDPRVLLLRARHAAVLPRAFGREEVAARDFDRLLEMLDEADSDDKFPKALRAQVLFSAASWHLRNDDPGKAVALLDRIEEADADEELLRKVRRLRELASQQL